MSDLILSLSHYHRHIAIYVVQIISTILGRMCLLRDLHFTLLYVVVSINTYNFYLTNCLNAHNLNTCIRLAQTGCTARKMALFIIIQKHQIQVLAAKAMATTIIID